MEIEIPGSNVALCIYLMRQEKVNHTSAFLNIREPVQLITMLRMELPHFSTIVGYPEYKQFSIPKRSGGTRIIHAPAGDLKKLQQKLKVILDDVYDSMKPHCVHGFIKSSTLNGTCNIRTNALQHIGKQHVWNIDIEDFFHSMSTAQIKHLFMQPPFQMGEKAAIMLALICCYQRVLPMGAPTSPVLSNLYCIPLDKKLLQLTQTYGINYTRYADDMTFSSHKPIDDFARQRILHAITQFGFRINERKNRTQTQYGPQWVTGIKVNERPNVDRRYIRKLRAILHDIHTNGVALAARKNLGIYPHQQTTDGDIQHFLQTVSGSIAHVGFVRGKEDIVYVKLLNQFPK